MKKKNNPESAVLFHMVQAHLIGLGLRPMWESHKYYST